MELNRQQKERLIYRHKGKDYKGRSKDGSYMVMPPFSFMNRTILIVLESLSDDELNRLYELENENGRIDRLEYARLNKRK